MNRDTTPSASHERREPARSAAYDVVALVGSAGGHVAIATVLGALPKEFPVPIVVMLHMTRDVTEPLRPILRQLPFPVEWARHGAVPTPGTVLVAPARSFLEILPDGSCMLSTCERGALDRPIDRLLGSLARSFGHRAIAVVLSGMLDDAASGARVLRAAGGCIIAQSGAEFSSMPQSVIESGGADVTLPVERIGGLLLELAQGAPVPHSPSEVEAVLALFAGERPAHAAMRAVSWTATPLGGVLGWPQALSSAVRNAMASTFPTCIYWGAEFVQIYNDAFLPILGAKPSAAGKPARHTWPELWSTLGPQLQSVLHTGKAVYAEDQLFQPERHGYPEELYLTYSYSPLHDSDGTVCGVLHTSTETTARVRATRRLKVLADLAAIQSGESQLLAAENAARALDDAPLDVPFALLYLFDKGKTRAHLAASVGLNAGGPGAPLTPLVSDDKAVWPLADVVRVGGAYKLNDLASRLHGVHLGPWPESPSSAELLPLRSGADGPIAGVIVLGQSPRLRFDPTYDEFLRLVAQHVSTAIGEAEARRSERERANHLRELDQAKVEFFSNVSHEFRTPLTLLLGPLDELLGRRQALPADLSGAVEAAARNGRRLLTLVNTLLDFSQVESNRQRAQFELTDIVALSLDVASAFRSAIEAAGLKFELRCDEAIPEVWLDQHMWEKILSNLLSNALKFTFEGAITVEIRARSLHAEITVTDTGIGIPHKELPNLFKRFHRVQGARARSAEGSGIGLWMVDDLVKRMGGQVRVVSNENAGTTFTIWVPYKSALTRLKSPPPAAEFRSPDFATQLAHEAARWSVDSAAESGVLDGVFGLPNVPVPSDATSPQGRILVADDNADMRTYLKRLLRSRWIVEVAGDGVQALAAAAELHPDLILADVMMPGLDGFELLKQVRGHPALRHIAFVLLTARVGEEAAIEGLMAGADDYIAKPFSPRELVARVAAAIERVRAEAALRASEERFRMLFEAMEEGFCYLELVRDAGGRPIDVITLLANAAYGRQLGLDVSRLRGRRWSEVPGPFEGERQFWLDVFDGVVRSGSSARREFHAPIKDRWFGVGVYARSEDRFAILVSDITERKMQRECLLKLTDALRPLADAIEIQRASMRVLGEHLGVDRVMYAEVAEDGNTALVQDSYAREGFAGCNGTFPVSAFSGPAGGLLRGETSVVTDVDTVSGLSESQVRASISVPLVKDGHLAAVLIVHHGMPRQWTDEDVTLAQEVAERTWVAVERARAETELLAHHHELERFHKLMVGRELRMIELKKQINALRGRLREPPAYPLAFEGGEGHGDAGPISAKER